VTSPYRSATEIADEARLHYETDAEFHAKVYRAAQIARRAENHLGDLFSEDSALLGAAVVLLLAGSDHYVQGGEA
jgi:hypothetical protein